MIEACIVRKLNLDDAEAWASLRQEALEGHPLAFGSSIPDDPRLLIEFIRPILESKESAVFGAFMDDSMGGIVGIRRNTGAKERHKALIWGMYVTAARRRNGAGEMLLRTAIQQARSWSEIEQVHLAVTEAAGDAKRLYERNGFQEWGREPRALCWRGEYADESYMVLDLRETPEIW